MLSSPDWKLTLVTNHQVSLQCPTTKYPCSAQPQSIPAVPNHQVSPQCPTTKYPCGAQPMSIPTLPNRKVSLQCSTTKYPRIPAVPNCKYPCSVQPPYIPVGPNHQVSLQCPSAQYPSRVSIFLPRICSAARKTIEGGQGSVKLIVNNGFRVGMLEVNNSWGGHHPVSRPQRLPTLPLTLNKALPLLVLSCPLPFFYSDPIPNDPSPLKSLTV